MSVACVIGNGPSRLNFDLCQINKLMTTYGCNALYRDFMPNYLISMDYAMVKEILDNNIHHQLPFYTQHENRIDELAKTQPINFFWGMSETLDSGNGAVKLALEHEHDTVYMIGFDYSTAPDQLPNVYSGTKQYVSRHAYPAASMLDTKWEHRLRKLCRKYINQQIIRVNGTRPVNVGCSNYTEISIEQFNKEIYE